MAGKRKSAHEVEEEIGATRSRIRRRVAGLRNDTMADLMFRAVSDGGSLGDLGKELGSAVRKHPLPSIVLGGAILWLLSSRATSWRQEQGDRLTHEDFDDDLDLDGDNSELARRGLHFMKEKADAAGHAASDAVDEAKAAATRAYGAARRHAADAKEYLAEGLDAVEEGFDQMKAEARAKYRRARREARRLAKRAPDDLVAGGKWVAEHPLSTGLAFAVAGAAVASAMAISRRVSRDDEDDDSDESDDRPAPRTRAPARKPRAASRSRTAAPVAEQRAPAKRGASGATATRRPARAAKRKSEPSESAGTPDTAGEGGES